MSNKLKMNDLINRHGVAAWLENMGYKKLANYIMDKNRFPSEQSEQKKGKWMDAYPDIEPNPMFMYAICSVCGCEQAISDRLNFCPDCGADMRGE